MNHKNTWDLIPWIANGTAAEHDRDAAHGHLTDCQACRDELEAQRKLQQAMRVPPAIEAMPHGSLQKLWQRIDAQPQAAPREAVEPRAARTSRVTGWLAAAVVLQAALLGVLSTALLNSPPDAGDAAYRTVSSQSEAARAPSVRAVFSPSMTLGELQALLERTQLRIVNGPSADGVYTLATLAATDAQQALLALRAHPAVQFAEPVAAARKP